MLPILVSLLLVPMQTVRFHYASGLAKKVLFAGDLTGWDHPVPMKRLGSEWTISFKVPDDSRFEYKLVVDGSWILDPTNPDKVDNGLGGENNFFVGYTYRSKASDSRPKHPMRRSRLKVGDREVVVYAPLNAAGKPILVYGDGPNYEGYGRIQNVVENLVEQGRIRPVVVVLVPPIDRMKEYGPEWKGYAGYLFGSVLPEVRRATGASSKPSALFLGGSSLGGVISLRLAEEYPDKVAGGVQSQSGAFQWRPMNLKYTDLIESKRLRRIAPTTRLWLDWGTFEDGLTTANEEAVRRLRAMHRGFGSEVTNEGHNWTAWRHRMEEGLVYLLGRSR